MVQTTLPAVTKREADVGTPNGDALAMAADLAMIDEIRAGAKAIRAAAKKYLPQYPRESNAEYERRRATAPWRPEFAGVLATLVAKPFSRPVKVADDAPADVQAWMENVDGQGNNLHRFARSVFEDAVADGFAIIFTDYTSQKFATLAQERAANAAPYLVAISPRDVLELRSEFRDGKEIFTRARFRECVTVADGEYGEREVERVRELTPTSWRLWERVQSEWVIIDGGPIGKPDKPLQSIQVALFFTGERTGTARCRPPLIDLAHVQIELYQAMSRKDEVMVFSSSPMLAGIGMEPPKDGEQQVGPKTVLYAPATVDGRSADWKFVQPDAANIREIREDVQSIIEDIARLGMQPMTQKSGDVTATATSVEAAKAHSVLESWAIGLRDALELAIQHMQYWARSGAETTPVTVNINTDFGVGSQGIEESRAVIEAAKSKVISNRTAREELQRRGTLGPQWNPEDEDQRLAEEAQGLEAEDEIDPITGNVVRFGDAA